MVCKFEDYLKEKFFPAFIIVASGILLSLFSRWELSGESWGYWIFARILKETGRVVIFDRGPLYIIYLNIFSWLGYPFSVTLEYLVTMFIATSALVILFRPYMGILPASLAAFLWIPFLQVTEPAVTKLALALSCLALSARRLKDKRKGVVISYALLVLAVCLRNTYAVFIVLFMLYDAVKFLRNKGRRSLFAALRLRKSDWPLLLAGLLFAYFLLMQSPNQWNNAYFATTRWFPDNGKNLLKSGMIQHYNWQYIRDKYGSFRDKDFYFTQKELFLGAKSVSGAIAANPRFAARQLKENIRRLIPVAADMSLAHRFFFKLAQASLPFKLPVGWLCLLALAFILYGAMHKFKDELMPLFILGNILLVAPCVLLLPKDRYMLPLIPVFTLSAYWYAVKLGNIFKIKAAVCFFLPVFLLIFSNGLSNWLGFAKNLSRDVRNKEVRILEERGYSLRASYAELKDAVRPCRGVMALEFAFIGAFTDIPLSRVYDVWEIPPFGNFKDSEYRGLNLLRIDCLLISRKLSRETGLATNFQLRYENYIRPYAEYLQEAGAKVYDIKGFGEAVVAQRLR